MQLANAMVAPMANSTPPLVVHPHPLLGDGRVVETAAFLPSETLGRYMERNGVAVPSGPLHVWHNGHRVPPDMWDLLIPRSGDQIVIRARALGGGGGGNKVLATVAMIALTIATSGAFGWQGLGAMVGTATGLGTGLASAAIMIGGSLIISPLLPEVVQ